MTEPFSIGRPIARGASRCHVLAVQPGVGTLVAACGVACGTFCGGVGGDSYQHGATHCAEHRKPLCERCVEIMDTFARTGDWVGDEADPEMEGVRFTVCNEPSCPETIPVGSC